MNCHRCQKSLRKDNTKGVCWACRTEGGVGRDVDPRKATALRFRSVTHGLGLDGEELVHEFKTKWLASLKVQR